MAINKVKFKSGGEDLSDIYLSTEEAGDRLDDGSIPSSIVTPEGVEALLARSLWVWGDQLTAVNGPPGPLLGLNDTIDRSSPVQLGSFTNWRDVSDRLATKTDGTLWSWGAGAQGALGLGDLINRSSPVQVGTNTNWVKASTGSQLSFAITNSSTLWSWGSGQMGSLGRGTTTAAGEATPGQVGTLSNWKDVVGSAYLVQFGWPGQPGRQTRRQAGFAIGLKTDGTLWSWGAPFSETFDNVVYTQSPVITGVTGLNSTIARSSPVQVGTGTNWKEIGLILALKTDGSIWTWGGSGGLNSTIARSSPTQIGTDTDWKKISRSGNAAIKNNGTLWIWGFNGSGQLGLNDIITRSSPVQVGSLTNWRSISGQLALKTDGTLWAWGGNSIGFLGLGDTINRSSPVQVGTATNWRKLDGSGESRALK